jgi:hypothetical protein
LCKLAARWRSLIKFILGSNDFVFVFVSIVLF